MPLPSGLWLVAIVVSTISVLKKGLKKSFGQSNRRYGRFWLVKKEGWREFRQSVQRMLLFVLWCDTFIQIVECGRNVHILSIISTNLQVSIIQKYCKRWSWSAVSMTNTTFEHQVELVKLILCLFNDQILPMTMLLFHLMMAFQTVFIRFPFFARG